MTTIRIIPSEMLKLIPLFGGDKRKLNLFLRKSEYIINKYRGHGEDQDEYVMHSITSRLIDEAANLVSEREDIQTWGQLRELLIQHFGDPRSEQCIAIELETIKIKNNENYLEFCNRIQAIRSVLISKVNQLPDEEIKRSKKTIYNHTSLNVFLYNLPENLVRVVRLKMPDTLERALEIVLEEVDFHEQFTQRSKMGLNFNKPQAQSLPSAPFRFGATQSTPTPALGFRPGQFTPPRYNFGIPNNYQQGVPQFKNQGFRFNGPQQFGYKPQLTPQGGMRPQQFGTQMQPYRTSQQPQQFGMRPQPLGYRPQFNQPQFGYRPPQAFAKPISNENTDVSMRTAAPAKPQQQGFRLNEIELDENQFYEQYYPNPYEYQDNYYYNCYEPEGYYQAEVSDVVEETQEANNESDDPQCVENFHILASTVGNVK